MQNSIINMIKGSLIGLALILPGLSGSLFAIVLGLYDKGMYAVANLRKEPVRHIKFLIPIGIGAAIGILASARLTLFVTERFPAFSYLFFIGLVIGSAPLVFRKTSQIPLKVPYMVWSALAIGLVIVMAIFSGGDDTHISMTYIANFGDFMTLAIAGLIALSFMAIPGISASIIIIILGQFGTVYNAISVTVDFLVYLVRGDIDGAAQAFSTVMILVPFALGAIVGIISIAKIMTYLLKNYEVQVYYFVAGALVGTVGILFNMEVQGNIPTGSVVELALFSFAGLACIVGGVLFTTFLDKDNTKG